MLIEGVFKKIQTFLKLTPMVRLQTAPTALGTPKLTPMGFASLYLTDNTICDKNFTHPEMTFVIKI